MRYTYMTSFDGVATATAAGCLLYALAYSILSCLFFRVIPYQMNHDYSSLWTLLCIRHLLPHLPLLACYFYRIPSYMISTCPSYPDHSRCLHAYPSPLPPLLPYTRPLLTLTRLDSYFSLAEQPHGVHSYSPFGCHVTKSHGPLGSHLGEGQGRDKAALGITRLCYWVPLCE